MNFKLVGIASCRRGTVEGFFATRILASFCYHSNAKIVNKNSLTINHEYLLLLRSLSLLQ